MEKKYIDKYYPSGITMEDRLFEIGRKNTQLKSGTFLKNLIAGVLISVLGIIFMSADADAYEVGVFLFGVGDLLVIIGLAGISIYSYGLRCLERAELLYNTRCAGRKSDSVSENKKNTKSGETKGNHSVNIEYEDEEPMPHYDKSPEAFISEVMKTSTEDLELILREEKDLYTDPELKIIEEVLVKRKIR